MGRILIHCFPPNEIRASVEFRRLKVTNKYRSVVVFFIGVVKLVTKERYVFIVWGSLYRSLLQESQIGSEQC